jgi:hypothetical protein
LAVVAPVPPLVIETALNKPTEADGKPAGGEAAVGCWGGVEEAD